MGTSYNRFSLYGFGIDSPSGAYISTKKGSSWNFGELSIESLEGGDRYTPLALISLLIVWKPLGSTISKFSSPKRVAEVAMRNLEMQNNVKNVEVSESRFVEIGKHIGWFMHISAIRKHTLPLFDDSVNSRSIHLYCPDSSRFFVMQSSVQPRLDNFHGQIFERIAKSFRCHELVP
jgi:hypothetical protein